MSVEVLNGWGWSPFFMSQLEDVAELDRCARIVTMEFNTIEVAGAFGSRTAILKGTLRKSAEGREDQPTVGDWVVLRDLDEGTPWIERRLGRKSVLVRRSPRGDLQAMAANVDLVFLTTSPNDDFSLNRLERYLATVYDAGAEPVIVMTKSDLTADSSKFADELRARMPEVRVVFTSLVDGRGLDELRGMLPAGVTAVLIGSSGVGKSSLLNALSGKEVQRTAAIREEDSKGRHTTVARSLFRLPGGGLLIDSPGIRELQLSDVEEGVDTLFADVAELVLKCKFTNCQHESEPGCAVRGALQKGELGVERWESFRKLQKEAAAAAAKTDKAAGAERKKIFKQRVKDYNAKKRMDDG